MTGSLDDPARTGSRLRLPRATTWLAPRHVTGPVVILIHGFTADGAYLDELAEYIENSGFVSAVYEYHSYAGIHESAFALSARLAPMAQQLESSGYVLVGHSMGGLVARYFTCMCRRAGLKGIALLGTPNRGALRGGSPLVNHMLDWADLFCGAPNPWNRGLNCPAGRELIGADDRRILARLDAATHPNDVPVLSVSGGLSFLEIFEGKRRLIANRVLQELIDESPNDGLVGESNADCRRHIATSAITHFNKYGDFARTNHSYLHTNQEVGAHLVAWISESVRRRM